MTDQPRAATALPVTCKFPGCGNPPAPAGGGAGRKPGFCTDPAHNATSAWRERQRLDAVARGEKNPGADTPASETPVTMARISGTELLRQLKEEAGKIAATFDRAIREVGTLADPEAVDAEMDHVKTTAARQVAAAEEDRAAAEARAVAAEAIRAAADQAAESMAAQLADMTEQLADAQARAAAARDQLAEARAEHATELARIRADAQARIILRRRKPRLHSVQRAEADRDQGVAAAEHRASRHRDRAGSAPTRTPAWPPQRSPPPPRWPAPKPTATRPASRPPRTRKPRSRQPSAPPAAEALRTRRGPQRGHQPSIREAHTAELESAPGLARRRTRAAPRPGHRRRGRAGPGPPGARRRAEGRTRAGHRRPRRGPRRPGPRAGRCRQCPRRAHRGARPPPARGRGAGNGRPSTSATRSWSPPAMISAPAPSAPAERAADEARAEITHLRTQVDQLRNGGQRDGKQ